MEHELYHHGIKGQKWGVRRYQNPDGTLTKEGLTRYKNTDKQLTEASNNSQYTSNGDRVINKESVLYRVDRHPLDPTFDNKKYLSTNFDDHKEWMKYLGEGYGKYGMDTYSIQYKSIKDIKVASETTVGKVFVDNFLTNSETSNETIADVRKSMNFLNYHPKDLSLDEGASLTVAAQTKTGKDLISKLKDIGYDAMVDKHGQNTSSDPIILFNPDKYIQRIDSTKIDLLDLDQKR